MFIYYGYDIHFVTNCARFAVVVQRRSFFAFKGSGYAVDSENGPKTLSLDEAVLKKLVGWHSV